jgi:ATP-dependent 26S proteasome regulatory subunit
MDNGIGDLLEACRARPTSTALQAALLSAVVGPPPAELLDFLATASPEPHEAAHRQRVAAFLTEAGRDAAARQWLAQTAAASGPTQQGATILRLVPHAATAPTPEPATTRDVLSFNDVIGLESVKQQVRRRIIAPFQNPGLFQAFRKKSGGGVLMYGPPGCGKTMLARATAGEANAHFVAVAITDVIDKYIGESERKLAQAFAQARARKPAVLFFDELEALAGHRRTHGEHGPAIVSTFLAEMDGFSGSNEGLLVLAATNLPWAVDPAFRRAGRFDRVLFVPPPDQPARLGILTALLQGRPVAPGLDLQPFAASTSGFSGADLLNLVETATELAIEDSVSAEDLSPISRRHLDAAMKEVRPTTGEWLASARNYAKYANETGIYDDVLAFIAKHAR